MSDTACKSLTTKRRKLGAVLLVALISHLPVKPIFAGEAKYQEHERCNIHHTACTHDLSGMKITLDITPKPVAAMRELTFHVILSGEKPSYVPYIDLGMPGMNMGPNRVHLKRVEDHHYQGTGIIVRCPSGRRTWCATVLVPGSGIAAFIFDVID